MAVFNGHKNWNHWNISLHICNDPGLYNIAVSAKYDRSLAAAVECFMSDLAELGITHTDDGAPYSKSGVRAALSKI